MFTIDKNVFVGLETKASIISRLNVFDAKIQRRREIAILKELGISDVRGVSLYIPPCDQGRVYVGRYTRN